MQTNSLGAFIGVLLLPGVRKTGAMAVAPTRVTAHCRTVTTAKVSRTRTLVLGAQVPANQTAKLSRSRVHRPIHGVDPAAPHGAVTIRRCARSKAPNANRRMAKAGAPSGTVAASSRQRCKVCKSGAQHRPTVLQD